MLRKNKPIKALVILLAVMMVVGIFPVSAFADQLYNNGDLTVYFQRDSSNGWIDYVQRDYRVGENRDVAYCLEGGKKFSASSQSTWIEKDNVIAAFRNSSIPFRSGMNAEKYYQGLKYILFWGYPNFVPDNLTAEQAQYATSAAIHWFSTWATGQNYTDNSKFGYSYWGECFPTENYSQNGRVRMRPKSGVPGAQDVYDYAAGLFEEAAAGYTVSSFQSAELYKTNDSTVINTDGSLLPEEENGNYVCYVTFHTRGAQQRPYTYSVSGVTGATVEEILPIRTENNFWSSSGHQSGAHVWVDLKITIPASGNAGKTATVTATGRSGVSDIAMAFSKPASTSNQTTISAMISSGTRYDEVSASIKIKTPEKTKTITITKESSDLKLTPDNNGNYNFNGTSFGIYKTQADAESKTNAVATLTLPSGASSVTSEPLPAGDYWVRELATSSCYYLNEDVYKVEGAADEDGSKTIKNTPKTDPADALVIGKVDFSGQDKAITWSPAIFKIEYFDNYDCSGSPLRTWYFKTGSTGKMSMGDDSLLVDTSTYPSDDLFTNELDLAALPLGSVKVTEVKAPDGYAVNSGVAIGTITLVGGSAMFTWNSGAQGVFSNSIVGGVDTGLDYLVVGDTPEYHRIQVLKNEGLKNGNTSMAGITVSVTNTSGHTVYVKNGENATKAVANNQVAATITLDENGYGATGDILPYGKYTLKEASVPDNSGYVKNTTWSKVVTIDENYSDDAVQKLSNDAKLFGITVLKFDNEIGDSVSQGAATLAGAKITIYNKSENSVIVGGTTYAVGAAVMTITTDANGNAATGLVLPAGKYELKESESSDGYKLNADWIETADFPASTANRKKLDFALPEQPEKGGINVQKVDSQSGKTPQGNTNFEGINFDIILSDVPENSSIYFGGQYIAKGSKVMTITTDANGFATTGEVLPKGYYDVVEKSVPRSTGMVNSGWKKEKVLVDGSTLTFDAPNTPMMFGVKGVKLDADRDEAVASGDATLMGAEISIINRSEKAVYVKGVKYEPGAVVAKMTTTADGKYTTASAILPYGSYELKETKAPTGYKKNTSWTYTFTVTESDPNRKIFDVPADKALKNEPLKETIAIVKWDKDRGIGVLGEVNPKSALEGIRFEVINRSNYAVKYGGDMIQPGAVVTTISTVYDSVTRTYRAETDELPYGKYDVRELYETTAEDLKANKYYIVDSDEAMLATLHDPESATDRTVEIDLIDTRINSLTVKKTVTGNMGNKEKVFNFELTLGDNKGIPVGFEKTNHDGSKSSGTAVFTNGKYAFTLRHGEQVTFSYIVGGNSYKVTELNGESEGYEVTYSGERTGTLDVDKTVTVKNSRSSIIPTGLETPIGITAAAALIAALAALYIVRSRKKER